MKMIVDFGIKMGKSITKYNLKNMHLNSVDFHCDPRESNGMDFQNQWKNLMRHFEVVSKSISYSSQRANFGSTIQGKHFMTVYCRVYKWIL